MTVSEALRVWGELGVGMVQTVMLGLAVVWLRRISRQLEIGPALWEPALISVPKRDVGVLEPEQAPEPQGVKTARHPGHYDKLIGCTNPEGAGAPARAPRAGRRTESHVERGAGRVRAKSAGQARGVSEDAVTRLHSPSYVRDATAAKGAGDE